MNTTIIVRADAICTGDRIDYNGQICMVTFAALVQGVNIELKLKVAGLQARMAPEQNVIVRKSTPITKVI